MSSETSTTVDNIDSEDSVLTWRRETYGVFSAEYSSCMGVWYAVVWPNAGVYWVDIQICTDYYSFGLGTSNLKSALLVAEYRLRQLIRGRWREYMANHPYFFANTLPVPGVQS